jgi:hypothetical protein
MRSAMALSEERLRGVFRAASFVLSSTADQREFNGGCPLWVKSGHMQCKKECPLRAKSGLMQRSKRDCYSITSSALVMSVGGKVRPNAFAVLRFSTSLNLVGCSYLVSVDHSAAEKIREILPI